MSEEKAKIRNKEAGASLMKGVVSEPRELTLEPPERDAVYLNPVERSVSRNRNLAALWLVWNQRRTVLRWTIVGLLLSTIFAFVIPKRYKSTARLMPPDQGGSGLAMLAATAGMGSQLGSGAGSQLGSGLGSLAGDLLGFKNSSDLFIGMLQSRTVQDDLINKFDLKKVYSTKRIEDARDALTDRSSITSDRKSGIISVEVTDTSPTRAAAMAGEYVSELNLVVTQVNTTAAHRERVFLEDRLGEVKQDLESAELRFSEFASKNTALDIPSQGKAMIDAAATLEGQLIVAQTELEGVKQIYADGNVRVRAAQARVDELRRQLQKNLGNKPGGPTTGQQHESLYPSIRELPALGVGYADLYRNTKVQEAIYETLTQEYELAKVQEAKETPSVKVLDPPDVPGKKSFPPRLGIMVLGTMLAMGASLVWVFGNETWSRVSPNDPQREFAEEVVHTIRARLPWVGTNGAGKNSVTTKV